MAKTKSRYSTHATQKKAERQKNLQQKVKRESIRTANREYKDTIFRMLFSDKKNSAISVQCDKSQRLSESG